MEPRALGHARQQPQPRAPILNEYGWLVLNKPPLLGLIVALIISCKPFHSPPSYCYFSPLFHPFILLEIRWPLGSAAASPLKWMQIFFSHSFIHSCTQASIQSFFRFQYWFLHVQRAGAPNWIHHNLLLMGLPPSPHWSTPWHIDAWKVSWSGGSLSISETQMGIKQSAGEAFRPVPSGALSSICIHLPICEHFITFFLLEIGFTFLSLPATPLFFSAAQAGGQEGHLKTSFSGPHSSLPLSVTHTHNPFSLLSFFYYSSLS